jgi:nicotinamidase-related amidase
MNQQEIYKNQIEQIAENSSIEIDPEKTLLLVVDVVNDGSSDDGFFKKVLKFDISMFQKIEDNLEKIISACKNISIPTVCVSAVYDFAYIPSPMRKRFEAMGIKGGLAPKGAWGSQIIDKLLNLKPDFILIKSHYSSFSKLHSFMYQPGLNSELEKYLKYSTEKDEEIKTRGQKIMQDYFREAEETKSIDGTGVITLKNFIENKGIDTLIITGGSTHVCEDAAISAASELGLNIIEPIDAVASEDFDKHFAYVHNHGLFKTQLTTTEKLISALK